MARRSGNTDTDSAPLGIEAPLWAAADKLRSNMDPAEYRHVVLGLVLLKYVSDAFLSHQDRLRANAADPDSDFYIRARGALPGCRGPDEYLAENVFGVPAQARWDTLQANARKSDIGQRVDDAMRAIEADNPKLRGVLPNLRPAEPQRPHPGRADETVGSLQRWNPDQLYLWTFWLRFRSFDCPNLDRIYMRETSRRFVYKG